MPATTNSNTTSFSEDGVVDTYVVPTTGIYEIAVLGAQGGSGYADAGGLGAAVQGQFLLTAGTTLDVVVGQQGASGRGGGGGGGSFVYVMGGSPLAIAGGGGGGSRQTGAAGQATTGGTAGQSNGFEGSGGSGGVNGSGGSGGTEGPIPDVDLPSYGAGGGGGFLTGGTNGTATASPGQAAYVGFGGAAGDTNNPAGGLGDHLGGNGGFGGGGGAAYYAAGGGGGYSGGGGGDDNSPGGGGGSYLDGSGSSLLATGGANAGNGSVAITFVSLANTPPVISGTLAGQQATGIAPVTPFSGVTVSDSDAGAQISLTITQTNLTSGTSGAGAGKVGESNGTLTGQGLTETGPGLYSLAATSPANLTAELDALTFIPTVGTPGSPATTQFTLTASHTANGTTTTTSDDVTTVVDTTVNDPPVITGTVAGQTVIGTALIHPFSTVSISDVDPGAQVSLVILESNVTGSQSAGAGAGKIGESNGLLSGPGLTETSPGVYSLAATSTAALTAELQALTFGPSGGAPTTTTTTSFTLTASQTINGNVASTSDSTTSVVDTIPAAAPTLAQQTLNFSVGEGQTLTNLYAAVEQNVHDINPGAQISIASLDLSNTMGFAYLDNADGILTYTADGLQPNAHQPQDSFTYTARDQYGQTVTGTVAVNVTGAAMTTQVGTSGNDSLTATKAGTRLIGANGNDTLTVSGAKSQVFGGNGNDTIKINAAQETIYGGSGTNTINLGNSSQDNIVLQQGGTDLISGFNLHTDTLDLRQVLAEVQKASFNASDFQVTTSGSDATLSYIGNPNVTGGAALATLQGVGSGITLQTLISDGVLKTT